MTAKISLTNQILAPESVLSIGFLGQKPSREDFSDIHLPALSKLPSSFKKYERWAWDLLPVLTLIPPLGTAITGLSEAARVTQIAHRILKSRNLKTASYYAFQGALSLGNMILLFFERPLSTSPLGRRFILAIKILTISHQIFAAAHRIYTQRTSERQFEKLCMHIASNIFCLIALTFNNRVTKFAFLWMQGVAGLFHAVRLADKDKALPTCIHFGMFLFRFTQAIYILCEGLLLQIEEFKPRRDAEELAEERRRLLISPLEARKTELSRYETVVKNHLGEEFLYFKRTGPEEKFLILCADADHNTALDPWLIKPIIRRLSERYDVKFRTVYKVEDIQTEIKAAAQMGRVMGLLLRGHGEPSSIQLDRNLTTGLLSSRDITPLLFEGLAPDCVIALDSCSTAGYPHFSIAYRIANLAQRTTFAADRPFNILSLKQVSPLEWSFENSSKTVRTKKLIPLEDDSFLTFLKSLFRQH
ncbi:MAG: hypothetical protein JSS10_07235 [Verrucomicrobia bacterium]|nr:hypothetical protein [Verrucomicrobiota bacterium]